MGWSVVHRPHVCDVPNPVEFPAGTIVRCDCGQERELIFPWPLGKRWKKLPKEPLVPG